MAQAWTFETPSGTGCILVMDHDTGQFSIPVWPSAEAAESERSAVEMRIGEPTGKVIRLVKDEEKEGRIKP